MSKYKEILNKFNYQIAGEYSEKMTQLFMALAHHTVGLGWRILSVENMEFVRKSDSLDATITCIFKHPLDPVGEFAYTRTKIRFHTVPQSGPDANGASIPMPPVWDEIVSQEFLEDYDE